MNNDKEKVIAKLTDDYTKLSRRELFKEGFRDWGDESIPGLMLIPLEIYDKIPNGTKLTSIDGKTGIKGKDAIDTDTRGRLLAWGLIRK